MCCFFFHSLWCFQRSPVPRNQAVRQFQSHSYYRTTALIKSFDTSTKHETTQIAPVVWIFQFFQLFCNITLHFVKTGHVLCVVFLSICMWILWQLFHSVTKTLKEFGNGSFSFSSCTTLKNSHTDCAPGLGLLKIFFSKMTLILHLKFYLIDY